MNDTSDKKPSFIAHIKGAASRIRDAHDTVQQTIQGVQYGAMAEQLADEQRRAAARVANSLTPQVGWKGHLRRAKEALTGPSNHPENLFIDTLPGAPGDRLRAKIFAHVDRTLREREAAEKANPGKTGR